MQQARAGRDGRTAGADDFHPNGSTPLRVDQVRLPLGVSEDQGARAQRLRDIEDE